MNEGDKGGDGKHDNVINLESKKKAKEKKQMKKTKGPDQRELIAALFELLDGKPSGLPVFPRKLKVIDVAPGQRDIVEVSDENVMTIVTQQQMRYMLADYCHDQLSFEPGYQFSTRQLADVVQLWIDRYKALPAPTSYLRFKSDPGTCWRRLDFDPEIGNTPTWDLLTVRIEAHQALAFRLWVASLFIEKSYMQNYVWMYGPGGNGKGAISRFLQTLLGDNCHYVSHVPREPNQFWIAQFLNKRLAVFADCENYNLPASGIFKTLTGGDPVSIEKKGKDPYTTKIRCKYLITSNQLPNLSSETADMRRVIFVRLEGQGEWDPEFEAKLLAEAPGFLYDCLQLYSEHCPRHEPIVAPNDDLKDWVADLEQNFSIVFDEWLALDDNAAVTPQDFERVVQTAWPRKRGPQREFRRWLERTHNIRSQAHRHADRVYRGYKGVRLKKKPTGDFVDFVGGND